MRVLPHNVALSEFVSLTILNIPIMVDCVCTNVYYIIYIYIYKQIIKDHIRSPYILMKLHVNPLLRTKPWHKSSISTSTATTRGLVVAVVDLDKAPNVWTWAQNERCHCYTPMDWFCWENFSRKTPYLLGKSMVSCRFP